MITMPLRGANGRVAAVIGGSLHMATRSLMPEITASEEDDPSTTVFVDAQGRLMSHSDRQWLMRDAAEEPTLAVAMASWAAKGRPMEPSGMGGRYGEHLVTMAGVPDADWLVARSGSLASVLGGAAQARRHALIIGAAVALCGGLLLLLATFFMLRRCAGSSSARPNSHGARSRQPWLGRGPTTRSDACRRYCSAPCASPTMRTLPDAICSTACRP